MDQHNFPPGRIKNCQICNSTNLIDVINLGDQPLANTLIKNAEDDNKVEKYPVNIVRCKECTLLQIDYIVDQTKVYHLDYPYLPGITKTVDNEQLELSDYLHKELDQLLIKLDVESFVSFTGHPSWSFLIFKDQDNATSWELKTFFMQEMFKRGVFTIGAQTLSYAHTKEDIDKLLYAYNEVFSMIKSYVMDGILKDKLDCESLKPLFSVR